MTSPPPYGVGTDRSVGAKIESSHDEVYDTPKAHDEYKCCDTPCREGFCFFVTLFIRTANNKIAYGIPDKKEEGERKDEGNNSGVEECKNVREKCLNVHMHVL